ncbi:unnamed protein product [Prorocentrum cordatum]|uniref:FACT complex subunit n=1 Tax=Prorocentrum cordatum TaxID=2364126 RepID=A0ABN9XZX1_9DINO|nr:unnamed protein product [Polarella glacialis]|mmetsp:Transcript_73768/g.195832  ORF Transcript_73768/g.195832 Transcript_73768/m.195832 type:complete len:399 (+) Transcript_73768:61-1257(+)
MSARQGQAPEVLVPQGKRQAKKKETKEEKAARLSSAVHALNTSIDFQKACNSMRNNPEATTAVKTHLMSLGMWIDALPSAVKVEEGELAGPNRRKVEFDLEVEIHTNFKQWSSVPPRTIKIILHCLEPISLNEQMLKTLCGTGQREPPRDELLKILEFVTGTDPSSDVGAERKLKDIVERMSAHSELKGRRGKELQLPVDWSKYGVYLLLVVDGAVMLKGMGKTVQIFDSYLMGAKRDTLFVDMNFSEARAQVRSTAVTVLQLSCMMLLGIGMATKIEQEDQPKPSPNKYLDMVGASRMPSFVDDCIDDEPPRNSMALPVGLAEDTQGAPRVMVKAENPAASTSASASGGGAPPIKVSAPRDVRHLAVQSHRRSEQDFAPPIPAVVKEELDGAESRPA